MGTFLLGILTVGVGFYCVYKTDAVMSFTGRIEWAEQKFGGGGSRTFIKLTGVIISLLGLAIMTGLHTRILGGLADILVRR